MCLGKREYQTGVHLGVCSSMLAGGWYGTASCGEQRKSLTQCGNVTIY